MNELPTILLGAWVLCLGIYLSHVLLAYAMLRSGNHHSVKVGPGWLFLGAILFNVWVIVR